ncbi:MAG: TonB-dependent receptor [Salinivirgaceae bacterium]|jgi:TonB-linked SusC/RagA family outer membrane protein|nr:TonB-dependent receptor [Salinivirgaceae bacterium]
MKKLLLIFLVITSLNAIAQNVITGIVIDGSNSEPLIGATVIIQGTTTGTITDIDGKFSLEAEKGAILVISFIGMNTQTVVVESNIINVSLVSDITLEEVVVVGYGVTQKKDLTGSVATVKGDELAKQPSLSPASAIQGRISGVQVINNGQPGSAPIIRIRGVGTILAGADPLYVVDGIITGDIRNINNSDITSIDILKDASSAAIYGARGANGVVIITTKAGTIQETKINYENYFGLRVPENKVEMADGRFYAEYTNEALERAEKAPYFDLDNLPDTYTNWFDEITQVAKIQNHTLSLNGGNEKSTHYFSLGYISEEGLLKTNKYTRFTARLNNTYQLVEDRVKIGSNINFSNYQSDNVPAYLFNSAYRYPSNIPVKDSTGNYGNNLLTNVGNPVASLHYNNDRSWGTRVQGNAFAEVKILEGLKYKINAGMDLDNNHGKVYRPEFFVSGIMKNEVSSLDRNSNNNVNWMLDNLLTYELSVGLHDLNFLVGATAEKKTFEDIKTFINDVPENESYRYIDLGDPTTVRVENNGRIESRNSYLGRINYIFNERYLITANFRADGSSKFSKENRWGYFPSVSVGWRLSKESFMANLHWIADLKIRGNWGQIGNDNINSSEFVSTVTSGLNYVFGRAQEFYPGATIIEVKDLGLQWEFTEEKGIGIDYVLFDGRISGELEYYNKLTTGVLLNAPLDATFGDTEFLTNKADVSNKGFEGSVNYKQNFNEVYFNAGVSATYNINNIENIKDALPIISGGLNNGQNTTRTEEGQPIGSFWLYDVDGIFQTQEEVDAYVNADGNPIQSGAMPGDLKYRDTNNDGVLNDDDRIYAGSYQPKFYFGINFGAEYKGFDASMVWYGNVGNKIYNGLRAQRWGNENIIADLEGRWTEENLSTTIPRASNEVKKASTHYLEDGDFLRLNSISLGYTLPTILTQKIKMSKVRIYVMAQNPITFQKYSGFTSEIPRGTLDSGIELEAYPTTTTYMFGVNVQF